MLEKVFFSCLSVGQIWAQREAKPSKEEKGRVGGRELPVTRGMQAKSEIRLAGGGRFKCYTGRLD